MKGGGHGGPPVAEDLWALTAPGREKQLPGGATVGSNRVTGRPHTHTRVDEKQALTAGLFSQ